MANQWGADKKNILVTPNSVDTKKFAPSNNPEHAFDVICVNRLVEWKGMKEVIYTCNLLNLKLAVAGTGPLYEELNDFAEGIGAKVVFLGDVQNDDLVSYFHASKIYILNSTYEATAYSLLEAMSCGLAPIARLNTGSEDVIQQNIDGLLVGGTAYPTLLDALSVLQKNKDLSSKIGVSARKTAVRKYDMIKNYQIIKEVVLNEV